MVRTTGDHRDKKRDFDTGRWSRTRPRAMSTVRGKNSCAELVHASASRSLIVSL